MTARAYSLRAPAGVAHSQQIYDPTDSGDILDVDGRGYVHGVSREQALALQAGGWVLSDGAERVEFETAALDYGAAFLAIEAAEQRLAKAIYHEIGRASGRGRGEISGGARSLKKKKKKTNRANPQNK